MKRNLLLLLSLFVSMLAIAGPVTQEEARQKVADFLTTKSSVAFARGGAKLQLAATSHYELQPRTLAPSYYIFNIGSGNGFVVAAADDRLPSVLGYSTQGKFDMQHAPQNLKAWLQGYTDQLAWLNSHPDALVRKSVSGGSISPLLGETEWNQGTPYNNMCPLDGGNYCVTGCVATAMAQVMYYHKWPNQTAAEIPGYTTGSRGLVLPAISAGTSIDWANMVPRYTGDETQAQRDAVAQLMLMCGTAVQMDYTAGSSGAYGGNVAVAWRDYFDYDAATIYEDRNEYRQAEWNQKVYDELLAGRPVYYDGQSSGGGHAFVIDGYDSDDYFHVNWGWGGYCNSYFLLSILDPGSSSGIGASSSSDGYSFGQGAIFGAQKNTGVPVEVIPIMTTQDATLPEGGEFTRESAENNFDAYVGFSYINGLQNTYNYEFSVGLFDDSDNMLSVVGGTGSVELDPGWGYYTPLSMQVMFGADMPDGTYFLKPVSRQSETETWYPNKRSSLYFITATISGNTLTLKAPEVDLSGTIAVTGKTEVGSHVSLTATITNNGTLFNDQLFLVVDGQMVGGRHFDINAGDTQPVGFSFVPTSVGSNSVSVCLRSWNSSTYQYDYTPIASTSVTITAAEEMSLSGTYEVTNATDYAVTDNFINLNVTLTNNSAVDYDNQIQAQIYMDGHDGYYYYLKDQSRDFQLASGATGSLDFEFTELENENYLMIVLYKSAGEWVRAFQTYVYTVNVEKEEPNPEPQEETGYFLVCDLNNWSTTDQSLAFTKLDDGLTWEITFPGTNPLTGSDTFWLKIAPASAYNNQDSFWNLLLSAPEDSWTALSGDMVINGGAWQMTSANNAASYTMRIVPSEMTYEITVEEKPAPFVPEPPYYFIGTNTNWAYDPAYEFEPGDADGTYTITVPAVYYTGLFGCKIAPANAIGSDGSLEWSHIFGAEEWDENALSGYLRLGDYSQNILRPESDGAESYTITINPAALTYSITINEPVIVNFNVASLEVTGSMLTGEPLNIAVTVQNDGNVETGTFYVFVDDELLETLNLDIPAGESKTYNVSYTPVTPGEKVISITDDVDGTEVAANETVTISDPEIVLFTVSDLAVEGTKVAEEEQLITLSVTNDGNVETGQLFVFVNDEQLTVIDLDIPVGESRNYQTTFTPLVAGDYVVTIAGDSESSDVLAETVVTIEVATGLDGIVRAVGNGSVQVYTTGGRLLASVQAAGLKRVMQQLPKGVYIVRSGRTGRTVRN